MSIEQVRLYLEVSEQAKSLGLTISIHTDTHPIYSSVYEIIENNCTPDHHTIYKHKDLGYISAFIQGIKHRETNETNN